MLCERVSRKRTDTYCPRTELPQRTGITSRVTMPFHPVVTQTTSPTGRGTSMITPR